MVLLACQVGAAAIEIWTMDDGYFFDNVVVSNSEAEAAEVREKSWAPKKVIEVRQTLQLSAHCGGCSAGAALCVWPPCLGSLSCT